MHCNINYYKQTSQPALTNKLTRLGATNTQYLFTPTFCHQKELDLIMATTDAAAGLLCVSVARLITTAITTLRYLDDAVDWCTNNTFS